MNNDPYKVLGVSPDASDDEIKKAYKELVKKYHPDQYQDNPLKEVADEKMTEVNAAYDEIVNARKNGSSSYSYGYGYSNGGASSSGSGAYGSKYYEIRMMIQRREVTAADIELEQIPQSERGAEWNFLKGSVCYSRGWLVEAQKYINAAASMDPSNQEYQAARNQVNMNSMGNMRGSQNVYGAGNSMNDANNLCTTLCCADCCCEMMGGDLIPCC